MQERVVEGLGPGSIPMSRFSRLWPCSVPTVPMRCCLPLQVIQEIVERDLNAGGEEAK